MRPGSLTCWMILGLAALAACGRADDDARRPRIGFVSNGVADFWVIAKAGAEQAARDTDVHVSVHMPAEGIGDQKRILEDLITRGVDALALSPIDPVNQTEFIDAACARMPVITHDSDAPDSRRLAYVGMDNYDAGRLCGALLREALPDGGEVVLFVGRLEQDNARRRRQGVLDALLGRSADASRHDPPGEPVSGDGYTVLATLTDQFDRARGKANVEDALARYPGVDACVGLFVYNTPLILEALSQAGRLGRTVVVGFDEADETLAGVAAGHVFATVVQDPFAYGYESVKLLASVLRGDHGALPQDGFLDIPARVVRRDDVAAFSAELAARLAAGR